MILSMNAVWTILKKKKKQRGKRAMIITLSPNSAEMQGIV